MQKILKILIILLLGLALSACETKQEKKRKEAKATYDHETRLLRSFGTSGAAYSPDGQFLAVGNREKIWVVDAESRKVVNTIRAARYGKFGNQKGLLFIDQNRLLVGLEGGVLLFNLATNDKEEKISFPGSSFAPRAMAWSPATQVLAYSSGGLLNSVSIVAIDDDGFGAVSSFPGFPGVPADLLFSNDGLLLAAAGDERGVKIREVSTGNLAGELPTPGYVNELARYGDNRVLVAGADLAAWAFYTDSELEALDNPDLQGQIDSQVIKRIAAFMALPILLYSPLLILTAGHSAGAVDSAILFSYSSVATNEAERCGRSTAISSDGRMLVDVSPGITKEVIRVVEPESGKKLRTLNPPGDYTCNVKFSPDGNQLLITTNEVARFYDTTSWKYFNLALK